VQQLVAACQEAAQGGSRTGSAAGVCEGGWTSGPPHRALNITDVFACHGPRQAVHSALVAQCVDGCL
jgi:hypothetical protein